MAEFALLRQMLADIVTLITAAGGARAYMRHAGHQVWQAMSGEASLGTRKAARIQRSGSVSRPLRPPNAGGEGDLSLPKPVEGTILAC